MVIISYRVNEDNINNTRHEANKKFRKKYREYPKDKVNELSTQKEQEL
jgi:hypothetical protein